MRGPGGCAGGVCMGVGPSWDAALDLPASWRRPGAPRSCERRAGRNGFSGCGSAEIRLRGTRIHPIPDAVQQDPKIFRPSPPLPAARRSRDHRGAKKSQFTMRRGGISPITQSASPSCPQEKGGAWSRLRAGGSIGFDSTADPVEKAAEIDFPSSGGRASIPAARRVYAADGSRGTRMDVAVRRPHRDGSGRHCPLGGRFIPGCRRKSPSAWPRGSPARESRRPRSGGLVRWGRG